MTEREGDLITIYRFLKGANTKYGKEFFEVHPRDITTSSGRLSSGLKEFQTVR